MQNLKWGVLNINNSIILSKAVISPESKDRAVYREILSASKRLKTSYDNTKFLQNIIDRKNNTKVFTFSDHIKGLIYSQLSNQTKWVNIEPHLAKIDRLFFEYNKNKILSCSADYFFNGIFTLRCGNIATKKQMSSLHYNIKLIEKIEYENDGLDNYFTRLPPATIVKDLSSGRYKLKYVGIALAWEFLRNIGIDGAKPDIHMKRILGADRLGYSKSSIASDYDVQKAVTRISKNNNGVLHAEIDTLIWNFCASGYGEICTAIPNCHICSLQDYCNKTV